MLFHLEFQLAVFYSFKKLSDKELKAYSVKEVGRQFLIDYPCDITEKYKKTHFQKRIRISLLRFEKLEKALKFENYHPVYKHVYYTFKIIKK